jgi:hypothetical protein
MLSYISRGDKEGHPYLIGSPVQRTLPQSAVTSTPRVSGKLSSLLPRMLHPRDRAPLLLRPDAGSGFCPRACSIVHPRGPIQWALGIYAAARANIKANLFRARKKKRGSELPAKGQPPLPPCPTCFQPDSGTQFMRDNFGTTAEFIAKTMLSIVWFITDHRRPPLGRDRVARKAPKMIIQVCPSVRRYVLSAVIIWLEGCVIEILHVAVNQLVKS